MSNLELKERTSDCATRVISLNNNISLHLGFDDDAYSGIHAAFWGTEVFLVQGRGSVPYMQTPDGATYHQFHFLEIVETDSRVTLKLEALGRSSPVKSDLDMFGFPQLATSSANSSDRLSIHFEPKTLELDGEDYAGFSVSYSWSSHHREIHWMYESVAIAPSGGLNDSLLMAQNMTQNLCPMMMQVDEAAVYSTQEHYDKSCIEAPCRGGGSPIFDLVQSDDLIVVNYFEEPCAEGNMLKANCQTMEGEDFVTVSDFHYGKLSHSFQTAPRVVLVAKRKAASREDSINRWTRWFDYTADLWCGHLGIQRTFSRQTMTLEGTGVGGVDIGMAYPNLLKVWEGRLDWLVSHGFEAINLHTPEWVSAANSKTLVFGGNNCCPWEFKVSDHLGGISAMKSFCDACHARGIKVYVWIAGHLHREAPIFKEHPDWMVRRADHGIWDAHYGVIQSLSFAEQAAQDWMFEDLKLLREQTGVDGLWFDSFTNLCMGAVNWQRPDRAPNGPAVLEFLGRLSELGYDFMIECMSALGVSSWGNLKTSELVGQEALLLNSNLRYYVGDWSGEDGITRDLYFRSLAARGPLGVWAHEFMERAEPFPIPLPDWFQPLTCAFKAAAPFMAHRKLFPSGALWSNASDQPSVWFAFEDAVPAELEGAELMDPLTLQPVANVIPGELYLIRRAT